MDLFNVPSACKGSSVKALSTNTHTAMLIIVLANRVVSSPGPVTPPLVVELQFFSPAKIEPLLNSCCFDLLMWHGIPCTSKYDQLCVHLFGSFGSLLSVTSTCPRSPWPCKTIFNRCKPLPSGAAIKKVPAGVPCFNSRTEPCGNWRGLKIFHFHIPPPPTCSQFMAGRICWNALTGMKR